MTHFLLQASLISLALAPQLAAPQGIRIKWGLENTWSYYETTRAEDEDLSVRSSSGKKYRAFAFAEAATEVRESWLACLNAYEGLWETYRDAERRGRIPGGPPGVAPGPEAERARFGAYFAKEDPKCVGLFKKQAPRLYFDFTADAGNQFVLERVEVTTRAFAEYRGGGFATKEAWYDILLSHSKGTKSYTPEPRLVFKDFGRVTLRLWSDNFYPSQGWMAPMGEYTIDIAFVFSSGGREFVVRTGPFKIDV